MSSLRGEPCAAERGSSALRRPSDPPMLRGQLANLMTEACACRRDCMSSLACRACDRLLAARRAHWSRAARTRRWPAMQPAGDRRSRARRLCTAFGRALIAFAVPAASGQADRRRGWPLRQRLPLLLLRGGETRLTSVIRSRCLSRRLRRICGTGLLPRLRHAWPRLIRPAKQAIDGHRSRTSPRNQISLSQARRRLPQRATQGS